MNICYNRLPVGPHLSSGIVEQAKRERTFRLLNYPEDKGGLLVV